MKGITTIAAIPSGAGQAAHLPAERAEPRKWATGGYVTPSTYTVIPQVKFPEGTTFTLTVNVTDADRAALKAAFMASPIRKYAGKCRANFQHLDATPPTPADKQGFEPPEYAERN